MGAEGLSVGIKPYTTDERENQGDNGIYVIDGWQIVERVGLYKSFQEQREYPLSEMLLAIDEVQPSSQQLGVDFLGAIDTNTLNLSVGDRVFVQRLGGNYEVLEVVMIAPEGSHYPGLPVVGFYCNEQGSADLTNSNNYLRADSYRAIRQ